MSNDPSGHQPQQLAWGQPPASQPNRAWSTQYRVLTGIGALVTLVVIGGVVSGSDDQAKAGKPAAAASAPKEQLTYEAVDDPVQKPPASPVERFKAYVASHGTPAQKAAVKHVTKVQEGGEHGDYRDLVEVYTDFTGGMIGPHYDEAKLLVSAFDSWADSQQGLVKVYGKDGGLLATSHDFGDR